MGTGARDISIEGQILIGLIYHPLGVAVNGASFVIAIEETSGAAAKGNSHAASWIILSDIIADCICFM